MFKDIYPQPHTGPPLRGKDKKDWMGVQGDESRLVRCRFCGFICDPNKVQELKDGSFAGKGVDYGSQQSTTMVLGGRTVTVYYYNLQDLGGCPGCGSYRWRG